MLCISATIGEVKQHIVKDISAAVMKYNRVLRKDIPVLNGDPLYELKNLDENQVVNSIIDKFNVVEDKRLKYINLDEDTMFDSEKIESLLRDEPDLVHCNQCDAILGRTQNGAYSDYDGNAICGDCMQIDSKGDICPKCGRKVPYEHMMSGFCKDCELEVD